MKSRIAKTGMVVGLLLLMSAAASAAVPVRGASKNGVNSSQPSMNLFGPTKAAPQKQCHSRRSIYLPRPGRRRLEPQQLRPIGGSHYTRYVETGWLLCRRVLQIFGAGATEQAEEEPERHFQQPSGVHGGY